MEFIENARQAFRLFKKWNVDNEECRCSGFYIQCHTSDWMRCDDFKIAKNRKILCKNWKIKRGDSFQKNKKFSNFVVEIRSSLPVISSRMRPKKLFICSAKSQTML